MDTDIRAEIDRCFGNGPAHPLLEDELQACRQALHRRRVAAAAATAGVLAVAAVSFVVVSSGPPRDTGSEVAIQPTETSSADVPSPDWVGNDTVRYLDGELQVRPGVTVHEHLENPFGYGEPDRSDGLDLTFRGQRTWVLVEYRDGESSYSGTVPSNGWASFDAWVDDQVGGTGDGWPETVRLTDDFEVVAAPGAEVLQRTDDPQLGDSFAPPGAVTGAAVVRVDGETGSYFVVWRVVDGQLDVITTPPRDVVGATFGELLSYARGKYASGEGLR
jgi:hypothetical protein